VRDLALQPEGPRQGADGTRDMKRMVKRRVGVSWEYVDHMTRKVRPAEADSDDDDDDDYTGSVEPKGKGKGKGTEKAQAPPDDTKKPKGPVPKGPAPKAASTKKIGVNDPCPCGSGKKYKKCHGKG